MFDFLFDTVSPPWDIGLVKTSFWLLTGVALAMLGGDFLHARSGWRIDATASPPAQEIVQRENDALPVYGLYCWSDEYLKHRDFIKATSWRHIRLWSKPRRSGLPT